MIRILSIFIIIIVIQINYIQFSLASIKIEFKIDNKIITNYDINSEVSYLKILNPQIVEIKKKELVQLAKQNLIKEIIKEKEIIKFIDINQKNPLVDNYYNNLINQFGFNSENDFLKTLKENNSYSKDQIKKKIKIELFWNELIYNKYKKQIKIDEKKLLKKIDELNSSISEEYFLSEIVFKKDKNKTLETLISEILTSIYEIGFNNTANIYSISKTANLGGKIGWINKNNLSEDIVAKIDNLQNNEITDVIKINNNFIILKKDNYRKKEINIDKETELKKIIEFETNKQLDQFSKIYFDKSKKNYSIDEN